MGLEGIVREVIKWEKGIRRRSWIKSIVRGGGSKDGECMIQKLSKCIEFKSGLKVG